MAAFDPGEPAMAKFLGAEAEQQVREQVGRLIDPVQRLYFTQTRACGACREQQKLLGELARLSHKLRLEIRSLSADDLEARAYSIDKTPAAAVLGPPTTVAKYRLGAGRRLLGPATSPLATSPTNETNKLSLPQRWVLALRSLPIVT